MANKVAYSKGYVRRMAPVKPCRGATPRARAAAGYGALVAGLEFGLSIPAEKVFSKTQLRPIVAARRLAFSALRSDGLTFPQIARECGGFHHTTVLGLLKGVGR